MKFQLVIEPEANRLILLPENAGEQQVLATLVGEVSPVSDRAAVRMAQVDAEWSNDRAPYKKLLKLRIKFGHGETTDVG